jgi:pimeloyl-ACP methyl ester carboxylesterase
MGYDIKSVACDITELLDRLAIERFSIVGHDWGGPIAFAVCLLAPLRVRRFAVIDVVLPGDGRAAGGNQGGLRWHHAFHRTPDLPEALTAGRESAYLNWFYQEYSERAGAVGADDLAEYVRTYSQPGAMRAGFEYYRSVEHSNAFASDMIAKHGKLRIRTLTVGGGAGRGRGPEVAESVSLVVEMVTSHVIPDCGHLVPEEAPDELSNLLVPFLGDRQ